MIYLGLIEYIDILFNLIVILISGLKQIEEHDPQPLTLDYNVDLYCIVVIKLS